MIGTFIIVLIGTGSVMSGIFTDSLDLFSIASTWIIGVTLAISTTADISGAHLNPAISIAFALLRPSAQFGWGKVLPYCFAQLVGAVLGSGVLLAMYGSTIAAFEKTNNVVRASASGIASAKAFGEYFR
jgi:glycerol uptake facilitator protein